MSDRAETTDSVRAAYESTAAYDVRVRTHELYSIVTPSWAEWLMEQVPRAGVHTVLDVGCGTGGLLRRIASAGIGDRWIGIDQSEAMVHNAQALADEAGLTIEYRVRDILDPPNERESFDLICACHMLYHVPDITGAVSHCSRLLSPQGTFLATTNSRYTMSPHSRAVWSAVQERLPHIKLHPNPGSRFNLENGAEYLVPSFDWIELRVRRDAFRFTEAGPWAAYLKSGRDLEMPAGHTEEDWQQAAQVIDEVVYAQLADGLLIVPKVAGVFLCRRPNLSTS
jgi:SAM-dependent methyltransferase